MIDFVGPCFSSDEALGVSVGIATAYPTADTPMSLTQPAIKAALRSRVHSSAQPMRVLLFSLRASPDFSDLQATSGVGPSAADRE